MAYFNTFFLKLALINIHSCRNKDIEISLVVKEHNIEILTLNETWLEISNYAITPSDRQGEGVAILCVVTLILIVLTLPSILIMKPL